MINDLLSRPNIQEFLNKYPSSRWKELITDLFEIGILNLKNTYHRDEFSRYEFYGIKKDLENRPPSPAPTPNYQSQYRDNQYYGPNISYPKKSSNFNSQSSNQNYINENLKSYYNNNNNYDYERRRRRLEYLIKRNKPSKMDAFYSDKNVTPMEKNEKKRRDSWEIKNKIDMSRQKRMNDQDQIKYLKEKYMKKWAKEKKKKRLEKIRERQAEEDIREAEREKRRQKDEEDYLEGYKEDHQEEDEVEEDEETDEFNDYKLGYDDEEEEEEGEEDEEEEEGGEQEGGEQEEA